MKKTSLLAMGVLLLGSGAVQARDIGYAVNSSGTVWRTSYGECWRSGPVGPTADLAECGDARAETRSAPEPKPQARAPEPKPAAAPPPPVPQKIELRDIAFDLNSDRIADSARPELDRMARAIRADATIKVVKVVGHTDSTGSAAYNQALSKRRAEAVAKYLREHGVSVPVTSEGRGEAEPIADNRTAEGRARNRRVELEISR